jgi:hypothetical protein
MRHLPRSGGSSIVPWGEGQDEGVLSDANAAKCGSLRLDRLFHFELLLKVAQDVRCLRCEA